MIIYENLNDSSNIMQILRFWNNKLVTQSEGKASFVVIFLLAGDHVFIYSLIMNEFLICAKP